MTKLKVVRSIDEINEPIGLTIGNFDGVHLGHQALIAELKALCEKSQLKIAVMSFRPHPSEILTPSKNHFLINSYDEKIQILEKLGIDYFIETPFNRDFSMLSPKDFLDTKIALGESLKLLHLGYDFAFGENKSGDLDFVKNYFKALGKDIIISKQEEFHHQSELISSTKVRKHIEAGEFEIVSELLGRNYFIEDIITKGNMRGRTIGFPTANLITNLKRIYPENGVYISLTKYKGMTYQSITNIGVNPTFEEDIQKRVETHIFDFDKDIYGEKLHVELIKKVRNEIKFSSVNDLVSQINEDVKEAREYFE